MLKVNFSLGEAYRNLGKHGIVLGIVNVDGKRIRVDASARRPVARLPKQVPEQRLCTRRQLAHSSRLQASPGIFVEAVGRVLVQQQDRRVRKDAVAAVQRAIGNKTFAASWQVALFKARAGRLLVYPR